jgi:hypothetical protein
MAGSELPAKPKFGVPEYRASVGSPLARCETNLTNVTNMPGRPTKGMMHLNYSETSFNPGV